jgi:hypothetical protein
MILMFIKSHNKEKGCVEINTTLNILMGLVSGGKRWHSRQKVYWTLAIKSSGTGSHFGLFCVPYTLTPGLVFSFYIK